MSANKKAWIVTALLLGSLGLAGCAYERVPRGASYSYVRLGAGVMQRQAGGQQEASGLYQRNMAAGSWVRFEVGD